MDELFSKYLAAFDAFDATAIANLYRLPCAITDGDGVQTYSDRSELEAKFSKNCDTMGNFGYQSAQFNILQTQELGEEQVAVTVGWRITTTSSDIDFRTLYICHILEDSWFIFSANVYPGTFD